MLFQITQEEDSVTVNVTLPDRKLASDPVVFCDISIVLKKLKEEGIVVGPPILSESLVLRNSSENKPLTGAWKFAKIKRNTKLVEKKNATRKSRARRPRKSD
jgi:hypothetical protein